MVKLIWLLMFNCCTTMLSAQPPTELYDLIKKLVTDSTGDESIGDWAVGRPRAFPVKWNEDRVIMSDDTSINFYRLGTADLKINGHSFMNAGQPVTWKVMIKGPRSGYTSFNITSSPFKEINKVYNIDSIFGMKRFTAKLLKHCDAKTLPGFYYYKVKIPKKDDTFIKISWLPVNDNTVISIDCYQSFSSYAAKLDCPK